VKQLPSAVRKRLDAELVNEPECCVATIYGDPEAYQLAFGYRDFSAEVDAMLSFLHSRGAEPTRVLELAAGPADHALEFARRAIQATALDLSTEMVEFAAARARSAHVPLNAICADMTEFDLTDKFDLALLMLDSAAHLHDVDAFVGNLQSVGRALCDGGRYLLEMTHPAEFFGAPSLTDSTWTVHEGSLTVNVAWSPSGPVNPVTQMQLYDAAITIDDGPTRVKTISQTVQQRCWTATEFDAVVRLSGCFVIENQFGALDLETPFDRGNDSWRMVSILRKAGRPSTESARDD
jgi:SAM-dependent methyltransferase